MAPAFSFSFRAPRTTAPALRAPTPTMWTSAAIAEASLVAGAQLANIDVPRVVFGQAIPRYLKLNFISVGTHSTGTIESTS